MHDEDAVLDRIFGTVRLNTLCLRGGERRAIADRFMPVPQGSHPDHYLRCIERMPWVLDHELVGIGSMCRRHLQGPHGILHVLNALDRAFEGSAARFHLFGLKSQAIAIAAQHPRVASADSQAYGTAARQDARKAPISKSDAMLARVMARWHQRQLQAIIARPPIPPARDWPNHTTPIPSTPIEARVAETMEQLRELHETGEVDWSDLSSLAALQTATAGRLLLTTPVAEIAYGRPAYRRQARDFPRLFFHHTL